MASAGTNDTKAKASEEAAKADERALEVQIAQLQEDLKGIADTLAHLTGERVTGARHSARAEMANLQRQARDALEDFEDQASEIELQLKDKIREKPFASVFAALGAGYLLALLSRH